MSEYLNCISSLRGLEGIQVPDKELYDLIREEGLSYPKRKKPKIDGIVSQLKRKYLTILIKLSKTHYVDPIIIKVINRIRDLQVEALKAYATTIIRTITRTKYRTIVHGRNSPFKYLFELGTTIHPIFGIPYIPASSLKGALRSYLELTKRYEECNVKAIDEIFGSSAEELAHKSYIIVLDAYPKLSTTSPSLLLEPEVITPIYADGTSKAPLMVPEHLSRPNPVVFPTIARGLAFEFIFGLRGNVKKCKNIVLQWIQEVLRLGIGGKTTLGYGVLNVLNYEVYGIESWI